MANKRLLHRIKGDAVSAALWIIVHKTENRPLVFQEKQRQTKRTIFGSFILPCFFI